MYSTISLPTCVYASENVCASPSATSITLITFNPSLFEDTATGIISFPGDLLLYNLQIFLSNFHRYMRWIPNCNYNIDHTIPPLI